MASQSIIGSQKPVSDLVFYPGIVIHDFTLTGNFLCWRFKVNQWPADQVALGHRADELMMYLAEISRRLQPEPP